MALFLAILVYHALVHVINIDRPSCFYATLYPHGEKTCFQGFRITRKPVCLATNTSKILKTMNRQLQIVYVFKKDDRTRTFSLVLYRTNMIVHRAMVVNTCGLCKMKGCRSVNENDSRLSSVFSCCCFFQLYVLFNTLAKS